MDGEFIMRRLLLLATTAFFLAFGAAGAEAAREGRASAASSSASLIEGRAAFAQGDKASAGSIANQVLLLGATALVLALGGVGVKALWTQDRVEFSPYGVVLNEPVSCDSSDERPA
jgi:hypothetical protein